MYLSVMYGKETFREERQYWIVFYLLLSLIQTNRPAHVTSGNLAGGAKVFSPFSK
jgi:hypothetical protein